jgi:hypothetical protein
MVEVKRLEAMVRGTLDSTDELVETVAMQQGVRLDRLEENGADQFASVEIRQAREGLRFALLDYQRGMHKSAHSNLDRAIRLINEIDARRAQEEYSREVRDIYARFQRIQVSFDNILTLTPAELKSLATGPNGASQSVAIATQISPAEFRRSIDQLYSEALVINAPRELAPIHEAMIQSLTEARIAALNFEKLAILNRVSRNEAFLLIDQAYIRMNNSNRLVNDVQRQLLSDEVRFRLVNNRASNSGR